MGSLTKIIVHMETGGGPNLNYSPARESLVSDIPAGDRIIDNLFYSAVSWARI
jgi:hypothetical protein